MPNPEQDSTPSQDGIKSFVRQRIQEQSRLQMLQRESQRVAQSRNMLQRLKPVAAGKFIRDLIHKQRAEESDLPSTISAETTSSNSSATITSKHLGPSDTSSSVSSTTPTEEVTQNETSLKRKRTDEEEELDEVAERVKRLKMERKSLWESFDDSQFKLSGGLLYDPKLWAWYW